MTIEMTGDWDKAVKLLDAAERRISTAISHALIKESRYLQKEMVRGINSQSPGGKRFKPLAEATLKSRRAKGITGTKALIASGELRDSIKVVRRGREIFTGVPRSVRHKGGPQAMNIAEVHESGTMDGRIPARPFVGPVIEKWLPEAEGRVSSRLSEELDGDYGTTPPIRNK